MQYAILNDANNQTLGETQGTNELDALRSEISRLRRELELRNEMLDVLDTHFVVTEHQNGDSRIAYCNRAVAEHHGYWREQLIGQSVSKIAPAHWDPQRLDEIRAKLELGESFSFDDEVPRADRSTFWVGATVMPLYRDAAGHITHSMSVAADITEKRASMRRQQDLQDKLLAEMKMRERALIELRMAQKLESVGRLAAGVAHEINTPIQYVGDSTYFLRSAFDDMTRLIDDLMATLASAPDEPAVNELRDSMQAAAAAADLTFLHDEVPKAFERTFEGVERVSNIVRAMKEFSHPDGSEFSQADINHALQNTLMVATNEYKYIAKVHVELDQNLPYVNCNIGELNQVFLNMIVNAAHAIQDAGRDISTGEITISTASCGDMIEIVFADNGCGIPTENLEKIYDPFFTTKEVGRGTGQGLAITRSIVMDKHGGAVNVFTEPGEGTQFIISLPVSGRVPKAVV